jgi:D-glycero-D-manno-heptose 1,7-bisphosphate phosphatase
MSCRAVFLDRDGVINRAVIRQGRPFPPSGLGELEILPGVREALDQLKAADFALIVVSNQPDVARGTATRQSVETIHHRLAESLPLDDFRVCYHDSADACGCRKPEPGLIVNAARDRGIRLKASFLVGDRWRDIEAGRRAGCTTFFVDYGYDEPQPEACDYRVKSLAEATQIILSLAATSSGELE